MIGEYTLEILCDKYNLSKNKLINKNDNVLTYGEYKDIDDTLNYLINELKISSNNIEKCPSILYRNVFAIKENVGIPVKFIGLGEQMEDLRTFDIEDYIYGLFKDMM